MTKIPTSAPVNTSALARRLLLHLVSIGQGYQDVPTPLQPFSKPGVGVTWIVSGHGHLVLNDATWELAPGPCFWLYSTECTRTYVPASGERLRTDAFWFGGPGLDAWLEELDVKRQPCFRLRQPARIHGAYRTMCRLAFQRPRNWESQVHLVLCSVLIEFLLARNLLAAATESLPRGIVRVLNAVEAQPERNWTPSQLATIASMSYSAFGALFRTTMHQTPHEYLQRIRVDQARVMLLDSTLRIKEIARRLHFCNGHYFSHFFHQQTGSSPTEYRLHSGVRDPE